MFHLRSNSQTVMDMNKRTVVPTSKFSCSYCKLLWVLCTNRLRPMKRIKSEQFCVHCEEEISKTYIRGLRGLQTSTLFPWAWPAYLILIEEAYCCYCPGKLCRNNVKLSECRNGLIRIHRYNEFHAICLKCGPSVLIDYIRYGFEWRCGCSH